MSWEVDRVEEKPCPCGEGVYVIEYRSDDWNRYDERGFMKCEKCKDDYKVVTSSEIGRKGLTEKDTRVVKK